MYIASNGTKTAVIMNDTSPFDPRVDYDNLGTMVCWHRRYSLGDKHEYQEPIHFASHLASKHLSEKDVFTAIKNGELSNFRLIPGEKEGDPYSLERDDSLFSNKHEWEKTDCKVSPDLQRIEDGNSFYLQVDVFDFCTSQELLKMCEKYGDVAILPLHLYDHSGISMSTGSFVGRAPHAEWDSGQVGYIYMDKETAMKELCVREEDWKSHAEKTLQSEVETYDNFLTGEVYGYKLYEGLEEIDSCWGFNPGKEDIKTLMREELAWFMPNMDFEMSYDSSFDIDEFFSEHDFPAVREDITKKVVTQLYEDFQAIVPFPYEMSFEDIRGNKDGVLDQIVQDLYETHEEVSAKQIRDAIFDNAGVSRSVQPKLSVTDLEPGREYTADELMGILGQKPSLADMIAGAEARRANQGIADNAPAHEQDR